MSRASAVTTKRCCACALAIAPAPRPRSWRGHTRTTNTSGHALHQHAEHERIHLSPCVCRHATMGTQLSYTTVHPTPHDRCVQRSLAHLDPLAPRGCATKSPQCGSHVGARVGGAIATRIATHMCVRQKLDVKFVVCFGRWSPPRPQAQTHTFDLAMMIPQGWLRHLNESQSHPLGIGSRCDFDVRHILIPGQATRLVVA